MLNIQVLDHKQEPIVPTAINSGDVLYFYYNTDLPLLGNEKWVWDFDSTSPIGSPDHIIQTITGMAEPLQLHVNRPGVRTVSVSVYAKSNNDLIATATIPVTVYEFPTTILSSDYIQSGDFVTYNLNNEFVAESYQWYVNGVKNGVSASINVGFSDTFKKAHVVCVINNGTDQRKLETRSIIFNESNTEVSYYDTDVTDNLLFFNKEGDNLNFELMTDPTSGTKTWEGEMIFNANSSDTFKTIGLYMLEKVNPLSYQNDTLALNKITLYNERGIELVSQKSSERVYVTHVEKSTDTTGFFTKWLYADGIDRTFPIGSEVILDGFHTINTTSDGLLTSSVKIDELNSITPTGSILHSVIANKRGAIMIITNTDNKAFSINYRYGSIKNTNGRTVNIPQGCVYNVNMVKLYDTNELNAEWNDPTFITSLYDRKKISLVNSKKNDGVYTVNFLEDDMVNKFSQKVLKNSHISLVELIPTNQDSFKLEIENLANKVTLSNAPVDFLPRSPDASLNQRDIIVWRDTTSSEATPAVLKKGVGFTFDTDTEISNLNLFYKTLSALPAENLLISQSNENTGISLKIKDYSKISASEVSFTIDKTTYTLREGSEWNKGTSITQAYASLIIALEATNQLSCILYEQSLWIYVRGGKVISFTPKTLLSFSVVNGLLNTNYPLLGIINDRWVDLEDPALSGYIHERKDTGTFFILNFLDEETYEWYALSKTKKIVWAEAAQNITYATNILSRTYLLDKIVTFEQSADPVISGLALVQRFVSTYGSALLEYGLKVKATPTNLVLTRTHSLFDSSLKHDYVKIRAFMKTPSTDYVPVSVAEQNNTIEYFMVNEQLTDEYIAPNSEIYERKIIFDRIDSNAGLMIRINGLDMPVNYDNVIGDTDADVEETLMDWGNKNYSEVDNTVGKSYAEVLESMGVLVWLEKSETRYDTLVIQSKYPDVPVQYEIGNTYDTHRILHSDIKFNVIGTSLNITINGLSYKIENKLSTIETILTEWVYTYKDSLADYDITVINEGKHLVFSTTKEKTRLQYQVWVGTNSAPDGSDLFELVSWRKGKAGTIISGNELIMTNGDFQEKGFATGMIVHIGGSKFMGNNKEYNALFVDQRVIGLSYQGSVWNSSDNFGYPVLRGGFDWQNYDETPDSPNVPIDDLRINTRTFLRYPREGYDESNRTSINMRWLAPSSDMFFYDFSGEQLANTLYPYSGKLPLLSGDDRGYLNRVPNQDLSLCNDPSAQQTVFDTLSYTLEHIDAETELSPVPRPIQVFVGFKASVEGVSSSTLIMERNENLSLSLTTVLIDNVWHDTIIFDEYSSTIFVENNSVNFINKGFKKGQRLIITGGDYLNADKQLVFKNAGLEILLTDVSISQLNFISVSKPVVNERSHGTVRSVLPPFRSRDAAFSVTFTVLPKELARINIKGQTEIEDERFKVILNNLGYGTRPEDSYIFKEYDIKEKGVDWSFLNNKRKEMLTVYPEIYNYLSSYKAIVNTINYFGYNDLELNEYYQDIDPKSLNYKKLIKIEIPDIFDNAVEGWTEKDYIKKSLPNAQYSKTKLFNLTYRITDFEGNNVLGYSLDEVIVKLLGLKNWIKSEVMMIGTNIKDLTGKSSTGSGVFISQDVRASRRLSITENLTPVNYTIESYLQPVANNSKTHMVKLNFNTLNNEQTPDFFHVKVTTFTKTTSGLRSVQLLNEFKRDLTPYTFAADEKIDRFIQVEVSCDNGYGATYINKKSYDLKLKTAVKK